MDEQDIGVDGEASAAVRPQRKATGSRRKLPVWAIAGIALLAGWVLGSVLAGDSDNASSPEAALTPPVLAPSDGVSTAVALPSPTLVVPPIELPPTSGASPAFSFASSDDPDGIVTVVIMNAPFRGVSIPADIRVIEGGVETRIELDRQISGAVEGAVGLSERRMLVADDAVVFMALDDVMAFDPVQKTDPVQIAEAIYLLPGSSPGRAWAVTAGSHSVIDLDVRNRRAHANYPLTNVGSPLASFGGGLVLAPSDKSLGSVVLWSPARGIEPLPSIYAEATFLGAAADTVVFFRRGGLAAYNVVTGWNWQTPIPLSLTEVRQSVVSPDGRLLAVVVQGTITELPTVRVLDIATGDEVDTFEAAFSAQLRWISPTELLFLVPGSERSVQVKLRDTQRSTTEHLTDLVGPNFWVAVAR